MSVLTLIDETVGAVNTVGFLNKKDHLLYFVSSSKEYSFGNSPKDVLEVGVYNTQKELSSYSTIACSNDPTAKSYEYEDVDGNKFVDVYSPTVPNSIQDVNKNFLIGINDLIPKSITSNIVYLSVIPISNYFSTGNPLLIKEISNSRKEIKLIKSFPSVPTINKISLNFSPTGKLTSGGKSSISLKSGTIHSISVTGTTINKIRFSKVRGGTFNGSIEYTDGLVYKYSQTEILLDVTTAAPKILFAYHADNRDSDFELHFDGNVDEINFKLNSEFASLGSDRFIHREIFDEISYELRANNLIDIFNKTAISHVNDIRVLKTLLSFKEDGEILSLLSSIYYGNSVYKSDLGRHIKLRGVVFYIENEFKFNFDFVGNFTDLRQTIKNIILSVCLDRLRFYNPHIDSLRKKTREYDSAVLYLTSILNSISLESTSRVENYYTDKFRSAMKSSLNFGSGKIFPLVKFELRDEIELVVKLRNSLPSEISVGETCSLSNISLQPFFQTITRDFLKKENVIKLGRPNFDQINQTHRTVSTTYHTGDDLEIDRDINNKISINKKLLNLNVDYTKFSNFVVFSSANLRVKIFKNKFVTIADLNSEISALNTIDSINSSVNDNYRVFNRIVSAKSEIDSIILGFDGFESHLYKSGEFFYNPTLKLFVKKSGSTNVSEFVSDLLESSVDYDKNNRDSLLNNSPEYIYEDSENDEYLKFLSMVGHHFDNIYLYITNMGPYKRVGHNLDDGISGKIIQYILNSFGFKLPPSLTGLIETSDTVENYLSSGEHSTLVNSISIEEKSKIIWKRMLLNLPSIYKTKGTEECIRQIFSIYGIPNNLIHIKEFGGGYTDPELSSSYVSTEKDYLLQFVGNDDEYIKINSNFSPSSSYKSVDFKLHIDASHYSSHRSIVPLHEKFDESPTSQIYSFGFVKTATNLGRFYFIITDGIDHFTTLTPPVYLFSQEPMSVMIRKNYIDVKFQSEQSIPEIPVKYEILINRSEISGRGIDLKSSFYLSGSLNTAFDSTTGFLTFGNVENTIDIVSEVSKLLSSEQSDFDFIGEETAWGPPMLTSEFPTYSDRKFVGCLDRILIQRTVPTDREFRLRSNNINCYYQGQPSSSYDDLYFRFNMGIPVDFSSASMATEGYRLENKNTKFSASFATLFNFSGSHITSSLSAGSCVTSSYSYFPHQTKEFSIENEYITKYIGPSRIENNRVNYVTNRISDGALSPIGYRTFKNNSNQYRDSNKLGLFVSPIFERNMDILNFFGDHEIISSISNPHDRFGKKYLKLEELRRNYYKENHVNRVLFNELFTIYKVFIDKSVFETLRSVLPARNKVYTGILIEPTILERPRIEQKPVHISEISMMDGSVSVKDPIGLSEIVDIFNGDINLKYLSEETPSYSDSSFSGLQSYNDRSTEYETNLFLDINGYVDYDGLVYKAYRQKYYKTKSYGTGGFIRRNFFTVVLIPIGSLLTIPTNFSPMTSSVGLRLISRKSLSLRSSKSKSRQSSSTTLPDRSSRNMNPIISIRVGPNIVNGNNRLTT